MYAHHDDAAMGVTLGPILANKFCFFYNLKLFQILKNKIHYFRYEDDCFIMAEM